MAAMIRLFRSSSSSSSSSYSRYFSTAAVSETVKSQSYPRNPVTTNVEPKGKTVQWVFLGCPGVGKGTYASRLSTLLGVPHIATGDLVRDELKSSGSLSKQGKTIQWVFLGCPGVGKGTYARRLSTLLGVPHIATGDLVRDELKILGPSLKQLAEIVNQGKLVSDEIILNLLSKRLENGEAKGEAGFILDGFPRTVRQAEILTEVTDIDLVVNLKLPESVLVEKCLGRRICSECGKNFNVASIDVAGENGAPRITMAPLNPPTQCISKLITRADDTEDIVKERLRIYWDKSQPVEDFYRSQGKLLEFDLPGGIPESWPKLLEVLNLDEQEHKLSAAA